MVRGVYVLALDRLLTLLGEVIGLIRQGLSKEDGPFRSGRWWTFEQADDVEVCQLVVRRCASGEKRLFLGRHGWSDAGLSTLPLAVL